MFGRTEQYAYAFARGKQAFADMAIDLFDTAHTDDTVAAEITRPFYMGVRERAEVIAANAGEALKPQTDKSRDSQVSKLNNFVLLGIEARECEPVAPAMGYARTMSKGKYTPLVACAVAMKTAIVVARKNREEITQEMLEAAIDAALTPADPETALEAVEKVSKAWEKVRHGDEKTGESPHADALSQMLASYPADYAEGVSRMLANVVACLTAVEAANAAKGL
jgi:hypothetical protein